ncbi:COG1361 S-layer family protein [Methanoculleus sp.]|uniref:COG1361 S-layer family protein n=1 Tax=Methanoculleus sp. TaxID=90427 RepID=UPI002629122C|nr:CARDB domain-containing protein [Methanoculleus sp.]
MKRNLCILLLLLSAIVGVAAAAETSSAEEQITVTGVTVNPDALMRGDTGTVTVEIKNTGETGVAISRAELYPNGIAVVNDKTYDSVGTIGPGNTMSFTFTVRADTADGIYYPVFYMDLRNSGSVRYSVPVTVESTEIRVNVVDAPETYPANSEDTIVLSLGNPRENSVNGVTVTPTGEGIRSTQTAVFLGALSPDEEKNASFRILASQSTELTFDVSYRNGINEHHATLTVPVEIGERVVEPDMVVNNIEVARSGSTVTLTGDVTNAGLKDAYSVKVTVDDPATATDPYPVYVVGGLESDDFSSFEVTCSAQGASSIPLVVQYRDEDGKTFTETVTVSLSTAGQAPQTGTDGETQTRINGGPGGRGGMGLFGSFGSGFSQIPVLEILLVIVGGAAIIVAWRKGYLGKIRDRFRR